MGYALISVRIHSFIHINWLLYLAKCSLENDVLTRYPRLQWKIIGISVACSMVLTLGISMWEFLSASGHDAHKSLLSGYRMQVLGSMARLTV